MPSSDERSGRRKPRDTGNGLVCASFGSDASWLSIGAPHPTHGFVELNGLPPFDPAWRGHPDEVRRYRQWMTEDRYGFLRFDNVAGTVSTCWAAIGEPVIGHRVRVTRLEDDAGPVVLRYRGRLDRAHYAEITDISPLPPLATANEISSVGGRLRIRAATLPATAEITVRIDDDRPAEWTVDEDRAQLVIAGPLPAGGITVDVYCGLRPAADPVPRVPPPPAPDARRDARPTLPDESRLHIPDRLAAPLIQLAAGTVDYILGCTALRVAPGEICIVTDHRLLPLSWTRDAYFQAALLLAVSPWDERGKHVVADHLRWLWGRSRQRDGTWLRSHLTNGRVKDRGVQADQQLYPLLELCEYRRTIGSWPHPPGDDPDDPAAAWGRAVAGEWQRLRATAGHGLLASDENPADDPSQLPYTLSSQILYWHTARQLARWAPELGLADGRFDRDADDVRHAIDEHFTVDGPFGPQWGYETDGQGRHRRYNDANDLPTAFAPLWGFCPASDPHWVATMRFTFSPRNPAYCIGPFGGLGSAHTPGTWPLGDVQQWVAASLAGDRPTAEAVLDKLCRIAAPDGLLPESYDPATGAWLARHWFAWPSAALAALAYC